MIHIVGEFLSFSYRTLLKNIISFVKLWNVQHIKCTESPQQTSKVVLNVCSIGDRQNIECWLPQINFICEDGVLTRTVDVIQNLIHYKNITAFSLVYIIFDWLANINAHEVRGQGLVADIVWLKRAKHHYGFCFDWQIVYF